MRLLASSPPMKQHTCSKRARLVLKASSAQLVGIGASPGRWSLQRYRCRTEDGGHPTSPVPGQDAISHPAQKTPFAATRKALADALAEIDGLLPGSVVVRQMRCGKRGCACKADPPTLHGPYIQWTRTVRGKTVTRYLSEEQLGRCQPWFDNARRLKDLVAKLEIASLQAVETAEVSTPP